MPRNGAAGAREGALSRKRRGLGRPRERGLSVCENIDGGDASCLSFPFFVFITAVPGSYPYCIVGRSEGSRVGGRAKAAG